ncbi:threonine--tRNA ligase, partial [Candidatus Daviesbacteria bacterium]|nr:threonine--tRNA ligase [Candidatus Daviesbacteria bacterium]
QPEAFKLEYVDEKGEKKRPVMIHRAIFGSFERFVAILTEHFQGAFPLWLSPVQVVVIPITDKNNQYAKKVSGSLKNEGIRVEVDERSETMQAKIRDAQVQKVPYMVIVGDREHDSGQISVRARSGDDLKGMKVEEFLTRINKEIESKS